MLNKVFIQGRIGKQPELKTTPQGKSVTSFSVAVQRDFGNDGNGEKPVDWFNVTAWRNTAEFIAKYFSKGSLILIEGSLQQNKYTDKNGNNREAVNIVANSVYFCDSKKSDTQVAEAPTEDYTNISVTVDDSEDNLPF